MWRRRSRSLFDIWTCGAVHFYVNTLIPPLYPDISESLKHDKRNKKEQTNSYLLFPLFFFLGNTGHFHPEMHQMKKKNWQGTNTYSSEALLTWKEERRKLITVICLSTIIKLLFLLKTQQTVSTVMLHQITAACVVLQDKLCSFSQSESAKLLRLSYQK